MRGFNLAILLAVWVLGCSSRDGGGRGTGVVPDGGNNPDGAVTVGDGGTPDTGIESVWVDPACTDGRYRETLPNASADISDLVSAYSPGGVATFLVAALARRYPIGAELTDKGQQAAWFQQQYGDNCLNVFLGGQNATAEQAFSRLGTIVHECGHVYDIERSMSGAGDFYQINETLSFQCQNGDTTTRGGMTYARSLLNADNYSELRPPCGGQPGQGCDSYADIYLDGNPADATFDSGDQGFSLLFEETVQYVNSLATAYAFEDQRNPGFRTSARDGILTFLWYLERYLKQAREMYPDAYAAIVNDSCWQDAILTVWGRAWLFLEATKDIDALTIDGPAIEALVLDSTLLSEIERVRTATGCN